MITGQWRRYYECPNCQVVAREWSYLCPCANCGHDNFTDDQLIRRVGRLVWQPKLFSPFHTFVELKEATS